MQTGRVGHTLCGMPLPELTDFPTIGSRARRFARFERDLGAWMDTCAGRFACWTAAREIQPAGEQRVS